MTAPDLWDHQRGALDHLAQDSRTALIVPMGGGKTRVVCEHLNATRPRRGLVLCPAAVVSTWVREVEQWTDYQPWPLRHEVSYRAERLRSLGPHAILSDFPVAITNYDVVWREEMRGAIRDFAPDVVVLDEAHRVKAPTGRISKALRTLSKNVPSVIELTGTPMPHSPLDVWAQGALTKPEVFGPSFPRFRERYAVMGGPQGNWVKHLRIQRTLPGGKPNPDYDPALAAEFAERFRRLAFIVTPGQVADARRKAGNPVPEPLPATFRTHSLPPAARKAYDELDAEFVTWVDEDHEATAQNALVKILRLAQLAGGKLEADDGLALEHNARALALSDLLDDIPPGEPVVVFCRFLHELDGVQAYAKGYAELSGRRRDALDDQGRLAEGVQVAGVQIQAGGVGVDLSRAAHVVFYGHTYSLGDYDQCIARLVRPGQQRAVSITHLLAENTRDQAVYEALTNRRDVVSDVIESARAVRA